MKNFWNEKFKRYGCCIVDIDLLEKKIAVSLPEKYKEIMLMQNGGYVIRDSFIYYDLYNKAKKGFVGIFFSVGDNSYKSVEEQFFDPAEFLPSDLVPFAGDSNLICFDYRKTKKDPPIVFWCHYDNEGEDVHFLANNFEEFINILYYNDDEY